MFAIIFLTLVFSSKSAAAPSCSRTATVNYQEILVDTSSNNRGEGLRYYLQRDPVAKKLLDEYQYNNRPRWQNAALSSIGSLMILAGLLRLNEGDSETLTGRNTLIFGGISLIGVSYLISRTKQYNNEWLLRRSIEEHNKRNTPRIYFTTDSQSGSGLGIGIGKEF